MERFNPFDDDTLKNNPTQNPSSIEEPTQPTDPMQPQSSSGNTSNVNPAPGADDRFALGLSAHPQVAPPASPALKSSRYTTSFPDPFASDEPTEQAPMDEMPAATTSNQHQRLVGSGSSGQSPRSNSVTFAPQASGAGSGSQSADDSPAAGSPVIRMLSHGSAIGSGGRQTSGGLTSFLSRATSVTSSSMTDRVNEAMRSAVDSLQSVPSNLNSKLSSATNQFVTNSATASSPNSSNLINQVGGGSASSVLSSPSSTVINRLRVILMIDSFANNDWAQKFSQYHKLTAASSSGTNPLSTSSAQLAITNFLSSATAQLTSSSISLGGASSNQNPTDGTYLVEQADFRDISVLANQSTSTATIMVLPNSSNATSQQQPQQQGRSIGSGRLGFNSPSVSNATRIIRPEYVVVRQKARGNDLDHLRGIVTALNYCLVPIFEPVEVWNLFQDRQMIFSKLLRIQKSLGKENFPLIPQVYCQTNQDLLNYINSSSVTLPCLLRTGQFGKGKMRADNLQMLKDFASVVATNNLSCTIEPHLEVKYDLVVAKLGTILKMFKRNVNGRAQQEGGGQQQADDLYRQSASRQTSLGGSMGVLSSLISNSTSSSSSGQQQLIDRRNSQSVNFEKLSDVNARYRKWIEAVSREFENKLEVFSIKILVTNEDREYIVGLNDCSMDFMGSGENQEEDRQSFVELIISNMNTVLPKSNMQFGRELQSSAPVATNQKGNETGPLLSSGDGSGSAFRRCSSDDKGPSGLTGSGSSRQQQVSSGGLLFGQSGGDKRKFLSHANGNVNCSSSGNIIAASSNQHRIIGQPLSNRSQSVSVNQSDYMMTDEQPMQRSSYFTRRDSSERSDSINDDLTAASTTDDLMMGSRDSETGESFVGGGHQRQSSLGQSFLDQTSTAFSSLHKSSLSFLKRFDSRTSDLMSATPPMSAKSDKFFDRGFAGPATSITYEQAAVGASTGETGDSLSINSRGRNGVKSQSVDMTSSFHAGSAGSLARSPRRPPKPPPPQCLGSRQSSLAGGYSPRHSQTPAQSRQNTVASDLPVASGSQVPSTGSQATGGQRPRVIRQNSALSAFEPFDVELKQHSSSSLDRKPASVEANERCPNLDINSATTGCSGSSVVDHNKPFGRRPEMAKGGGTNLDSASITSGDSNSTSETTTTTEDTMNNLKKTFASIFGDRNTE